MKKNIKCLKCATVNIIVENPLFFSEEKEDYIISCCICNEYLSTEKTDGWFFVQSTEQQEFEKKIDIQKEKITFS